MVVNLKVLITGDAGFVGRHFRTYLEAQGDEIVGVDIVNGLDARDFFKTNNDHFDLVIHLAAVVGGRKLIEGSPLSLAVDLSIDAEMFGWAMRTRPERIVYFSSSAAYPTQLQHLDDKRQLKEADIDLDRIATPDLSYGWAKLTGEMLANHARKARLKVHIFRPFSGYGEDQALDYPFPSFIARAKERKDPFEIWGDGNQVRDFIHIDDIVEAVFAAIANEVKTVNLCTGRATSFNDLAQIVCEIAGYTPAIKHLKSEPVGVSYRVGSPSLMFSFYTPKISLEEGVKRALALS